MEKNKDFLVENMQEICFVNSWLNNARSSHQIVKDIDFFFLFFWAFRYRLNTSAHLVVTHNRTYTLCTEINFSAYLVVAHNHHDFNAKCAYGCVSMK